MNKNLKTGICAFTLPEVLLALAIAAVLINVGIVSGIDSYTRGLARTDRILVVAALREARTQALSNIDLAPHGIYITTSGLTLFEGNSFATRTKSADSVIPFSVPEIISSSDTPSTGTAQVVFAALSAAVSAPLSFQLTSSDHHTETISSNADGVITATP